MISAEEKTQKRRIHRIKQMWKLCCAAEIVLARLGFKATVTDILREAKMSRRSFYDFFASLESMIDTMYEAAQDTRLRGHVGIIPVAPWMVLAADPTGSATVARIGCRPGADEAFARADNTIIHYEHVGRAAYLAAPESSSVVQEWGVVMKGLGAE